MHYNVSGVSTIWNRLDDSRKINCFLIVPFSFYCISQTVSPTFTVKFPTHGAPRYNSQLLTTWLQTLNAAVFDQNSNLVHILSGVHKQGGWQNAKSIFFSNSDRQICFRSLINMSSSEEILPRCFEHFRWFNSLWTNGFQRNLQVYVWWCTIIRETVVVIPLNNFDTTRPTRPFAARTRCEILLLYHCNHSSN